MRDLGKPLGTVTPDQALWRSQPVAKPGVRASEQTTILVVANDVSNRSLLAVVPSTLGYSKLKARDNVTALALEAQNSVAGILADVLMPNIDGFEVCPHLKRHSVTAHIPVILITAPEIRNTAFAEPLPAAVPHVRTRFLLLSPRCVGRYSEPPRPGLGGPYHGRTGPTTRREFSVTKRDQAGEWCPRD